MTNPEETPWTEVREDVLSRLVADARPYHFYGYEEELLEACADVLAASGGDDLVFVGRSPEPMYDLLSSLLKRTKSAPTLRLLPFSFRYDSGIRKLHEENPASTEALENLFRKLELSPSEIAASQTRISFVDLVCWGTTLARLEETLEFFAEQESVDSESISRQVRYVGITKESIGWTHWRNDEESNGARFFAEGRAKVVTVSARLWDYLGDQSGKTTESFTPESWKDGVKFSPLNSQTARALRSTVDTKVLGYRAGVRKVFASKLARRAGSKEKWLLSLVGRLLKSARL